MAKNDFQYGGWNSYTLQCGMWLWNRDSEFTRWQHPAVWQVALGWHAIDFTQTSAILEFYIWFPFPHITAVDMSFCSSLRHFIQIGPPSAENKRHHVHFQDGGSQPSWILGIQWRVLWKALVRLPIVVNRHRRSKLLSFFRKSRFAIWRQTDRQTDRKTNRRTRLSHKAALAVASGGLTSSYAAAKRPRDASCLSVVSFNCTIPRAQFFIISFFGFRFSSAYNSILFCCLRLNIEPCCHSHTHDSRSTVIVYSARPRLVGLALYTAARRSRLVVQYPP